MKRLCFVKENEKKAADHFFSLAKFRPMNAKLLIIVDDSWKQQAGRIASNKMADVKLEDVI